MQNPDRSPDLNRILTTLQIVPAVEAELPDSAPGCEPWCHERGARRLPAEALPVDPSRVPTISETLRTYRYEYCRCEAGDRARERHETAIRAAAVREVQIATERLWAAAQVPTGMRGYTFESYLRLPHASRRAVEIMRCWQPVAARGCSMILHGGPGLYKTSLAVSALNEQLENGERGLFLVCDDWLSMIRATYPKAGTSDDRAATEWKLIAEAAAAPLLVLDDVETLTEWGRQIVFRLLNQRHSWLRPTILTTNLSLEDLEATLGDKSFDRVRERAVHPTTGESFVLAFEGESRRGLVAVPS